MLEAERIRERYFNRVDVEALNPVSARKYKLELRKARTKARKLPAGTLCQAELVKLLDEYIEVMDAVIKNEGVEQAMDRGRESFHRYVARVGEAYGG
jgi:hypothetical protein